MSQMKDSVAVIRGGTSGIRHQGALKGGRTS